ncbi:MAG: hypothetical protein RL238_869 [Actinomycetota bacterium]|jgi:hypothetical protein
MNDLDPTAARIATLLDEQASHFEVRGASLDRVKRRGRQRRQRRLASVGVLGAAASVGGLALLVDRGGPSTARPAVDSTTPSSQAPDTTAPIGFPGAVLEKGSTGDAVRRLQDRLHQLGFDPGPSDGAFGAQTEQAVWAFEGVVLGRAWAEQTGTVDAGAWGALFDTGLVVEPRREVAGGHTEIYLDTQALIVFDAGRPVLISHISSGSGEQWCETQIVDEDAYGDPLPQPEQRDVCGVANTPGGVFMFYRHRTGDVATPLGGMHNPVFFNYTIAVAGTLVVPKEPVSHGGVRIPMAIAEYFPTLVDEGDLVYVWDGGKEPEEQTREEMTPTFTYPDPAATGSTVLPPSSG